MLSGFAQGADSWVTYEGGEGPGKGRHVVLVSGDEEYRSEEALPQLGKILAKRHGFRCTVLFAINPEGEIDPNKNDNIPGLEQLESADLLVLFTRFRNLPDEQMQYVAKYVESGRPIIGLRTATHAFQIKGESKFSRYSWQSKEWDGGFGRHILGETWISHHGAHGRQSTRGILAKERADHPILSGLKDGDVWGPTDVYGVRLPLPDGCQPLVYGQVLTGMKSDDPPLEGSKNDPLMPIAWVRNIESDSGKVARVFTTTMGASTDLQSEGLRRLLVNAVYWCEGLESQIRPDADVSIVGDFEPLPFGFNGAKKGVRPEDHRLVE